MSWHRLAACAGSDLDPARVEFRDGCCAHCPVIDECGEAAMAEEGDKKVAHRSLYRGGMSPAERARRAKARQEVS